MQVSVETKLWSQHHVRQVKEVLPPNSLPVVGHFRITGNKHTSATGRIRVLSKHRSHDCRRMRIYNSLFKAISRCIVDVRRQLQQPMHLRRIGVGRKELDATRNYVSWIEHGLILPHRKQRMSQTSDADIRVHHLATDEPSRVNIPSRKIGRRTSHQASPQHCMGSSIDKFVGRPVGL